MVNSGGLIERLFQYAVTCPDHSSVVSSSLNLTYAQLAQLVRAQAIEFIDAGISAESVIGIKCSDDPQHLVLCLAAIYVGATSCTIPTFETAETQQAVIEQCGADFVIEKSVVGESVSPGVTLELMHIQKTPAQYANLLFSTSGTTGNPKLVVHQDNDLVAQAHRHIQSDKERFACMASMEHNFAKRHRLYCVAAGATNVFVEAHSDTGQDSLVAQVRSLDVNVLHVSAFQAQGLLAVSDRSALSNIRLKLGGSHVSKPLRKKLRDKVTKNLQAGYGTTETGAIAFTDSSDEKSGESVGRALPGIEVRIVSPDKQPLDIGERGEMVVRCRGMFRAYLGQAELTSSRLENGWFYTGDIAYLDSQQRIHLCGRSDDMFVFNSMNIYPQDIESELCQHPHITEAVVLPKASAVHGHIPLALVVYEGGAKPDLLELKKFIEARVGVRRPRGFTVVKEIPRNASGKVSRRDAITLYEESDQVRHTLGKLLLEDKKTPLNSDVITAFINDEHDLKISSIRMDSLTRMEMLVALELDYDIDMAIEEFARFRYLGDIVSHVSLTRSREAVKRATFSDVQRTNRGGRLDGRPKVVQFFQRIIKYCHTPKQLKKAYRILDHRLTPVEMRHLEDWHNKGHLILDSLIPEFESITTTWLEKVKRMMLGSGKEVPEPFESRRIVPTVTHFYKHGTRKQKTLLICFAGRGARNFGMPNAVFMQHIDSQRYDILFVSESLRKSYRLGVPLLGRNVEEVVEWLSNLDLIGEYGAIRVFGYSAGAYPAIMTAYRLNAEMVVSVAGRFPVDKRRHPMKNIGRIIDIWRAVRKGHCSRVMLCCAEDITRDRKFAMMTSWLSAGNQVDLKFFDRKIHHVISYLARQAQLKTYLQQSIFAELDDELVVSKRARQMIDYTVE